MLTCGLVSSLVSLVFPGASAGFDAVRGKTSSCLHFMWSLSESALRSAVFVMLRVIQSESTNAQNISETASWFVYVDFADFRSSLCSKFTCSVIDTNIKIIHVSPVYCRT